MYLSKSIYTFFIVFFFAAFQGLFAQNGCGCNDCNILIANDLEQIIYINIEGAAQNNLAQANQALSDIRLKFSHNKIAEVGIELRAPSGQTVQLVEQNADSSTTLFTTWNVHFRPCALFLNSDPGFTDNFGQNQWVNNLTLTGDYYPSAGCLEDFNAGPVNGLWQLIITEKGGTPFTGFVFEAELAFEDMTGLSCSTAPLPPPVLGGTCDSAGFVPNLNGFLGHTYENNNHNDALAFCGTQENNTWLEFLAPSDSLQISIIAGNCALGNGLQAAIYTDCVAPPLACLPGESAGISIHLVFNLTDLVPGDPYKLLIDGFAGDVCDFFITTNQTSTLLLGNPEEPLGAASTCVPTTETYSTQASYGAGGYLWEILGNGLFNQNSTKKLVQFGPNPLPVDVDWQTGGGALCVRAFSGPDTSMAACRNVLTDSVKQINLPLVRLCAEDLPYISPYGPTPITSSGIYSFTKTQVGGCDSLILLPVEVSTFPAEVAYPPILLANNQCFALPNGMEICDAGLHEVSIMNPNACETLHRFSIHKIQYTPLNLACAPAVVPFTSEGVDTSSLQWFFPGGMPTNPIGGSVEATYENAGTYGFRVVLNGQTYQYNNQFNLSSAPSAVISQNTQGNVVSFSNAGSGNPSTIHWDFGNGVTAQGSNQIYEYSQDGIYEVQLVATNPCGSDTAYTTVVIGMIPSQEPNQDFQKLTVYPNPSSGSFFVQTPQETGQLTVYTALNQAILHKKVSGFESGIALNLVEKGLFRVVFVGKNAVYSAWVSIL